MRHTAVSYKLHPTHATLTWSPDILSYSWALNISVYHFVLISYYACVTQQAFFFFFTLHYCDSAVCPGLITYKVWESTAGKPFFPSPGVSVMKQSGSQFLCFLWREKISRLCIWFKWEGGFEEKGEERKIKQTEQCWLIRDERVIVLESIESKSLFQ